MAFRLIDYLKSRFVTGAKPTQADFSDWMDSTYIYQKPKPASFFEGAAWWDGTKKAFTYYNDASDVEVRTGQQILIRVKNESGSSIPKGSIVYPSGQSTDGNTLINLADCTVRSKCRLVGMTAHTIPNNSTGYVTRIGEVEGLNTSTLSQALVYLDPDTPGGITITRPDMGSFVIAIGACKKVHVTDGIIIVDPNITELTAEVTDTNGFTETQKANTTLSVVDGTRTFTISASSYPFHYYINGNKFTQTSAQSLVFPDSEGLHVLYFDSNGFQSILNPTPGEMKDIILNQCYVGEIYWDATNKMTIVDVGDRRYGISMSPATHYFNWYLIKKSTYLNGLTLANFLVDQSGDLNTHAQFSVSSGEFLNADITFPIPAKTVGQAIKVIYLSGALGLSRQETQTNFAFLNAPGGRPYYNQYTGGAWQKTQVTSGYFVLYHIAALGGQTDGLISLMGQNQYSSIADAKTGANNEIANMIGLSKTSVYIPIGTFILECKDNFGNSVKARIVSVDVGVPYKDWRTVSTPAGTIQATDHQNLSNLFLAGAGVNYGHVNEALFNEIKTANQLQWQFDTSTTKADPGAGKFRRNATGTELYINLANYLGSDMYPIFSVLKSGAAIYAQCKSSSSRQLIGLLSADPVSEGSYYTFAITTADYTAFSLNDVVGFVFINPAGSGGGDSPIRAITQTPIIVEDSTITDIVIGDDVKTYEIENGAAYIAFTVSGGSDTEEHTAKRVIDNSGNSSAVLIEWSNTGLDWTWLVGDPITTVPAGAKLVLEIQVESSTQVLATTDLKA